MNQNPDDRVDLTSLRQPAAERAARIATRVAERVAEARSVEGRRRALLEGVRRRLARLAIPIALLAAASLAVVLATRRAGEGRPERFAVVLLGPGPVAQWVASGRQPDVSELLTVVGGGR